MTSYSNKGSTGDGGASPAGTAKAQGGGAPGTNGGNGTDVSSIYPGTPNSGIYAGGGGGGGASWAGHKGGGGGGQPVASNINGFGGGGGAASCFSRLSFNA